jgi:hypothetical protein
MLMPVGCLLVQGNILFFVKALNRANRFGSWNKNLAYERALAMGGEFRTKGVNVALRPGIS